MTLSIMAITHDNTITYNNMLMRSKELNRIQEQGIILLEHKSKALVCVGMTLSSIGILTAPAPTGSAILIPLGCTLMVKGGMDIQRLKTSLMRKIRVKIMRWFK